MKRKTADNICLVSPSLKVGGIERALVVLAFGDWLRPLVLLALYGTKYPVYISDRTKPDYNLVPMWFLKQPLSFRN